MHKLITSAKNTDDLSIGFNPDRNSRQRELTNNKNEKGKYLLGIMLKDAFGFAKHQQKATHGLGYILTLTGVSENSVLNKDNAINNGKIETNNIEGHVPHYTPSIPQQALLSKQTLIQVPTDLQEVERSVLRTEVETQNLWSFDIGKHEGINIPIRKM